MPRFPVFLLLAAAACTGGPPDAAAPDTIEPGLVAVSGTVFDSLLGTPVEGVRVVGGTNGALAVTGPDGFYRLQVHQEPSSIWIDDVRYQPVSVASRFTGPDLINLRLVRFAPAILHCSLAGAYALATVVDLQGRKTVDRRMASHAVAAVAGGPTASSVGDDWAWHPVDNFTWMVEIPVLPGVTSLTLTVADADLNSMTSLCNDPPTVPQLD